MAQNSLNRMVTERLDEYRILQSIIPPYHAQANPMETVDRNLRPMINSFLADDHTDCDLHLSKLCLTLNNAVHSSSGISPAFPNLGKNPVPSTLL